MAKEKAIKSVEVAKEVTTSTQLGISINVLDGGKLPTKAHEDDACYDLYVRSIDKYYTHTKELRIVYYCGIRTQIPTGYEAVVRPRSSIRKYDMLMTNAPGTIDSGYTGEWSITMALLKPMEHIKLQKLIAGKIVIGSYNIGDKIAQFAIKKVENIMLVEVDKLEETARGDNGHGSSGR